MELANILLETGLFIRVNGYKTKGVGKEDNNGQMGRSLMGITWTIKKMGRVSLNGQMEITLLGNLRTTENVGKEQWNTVMEDNMSEIGSMIRWMDMDSSAGPAVKTIKACMKRIWNMERAKWYMVTELFMMVNGFKGSKMAKALSQTKWEENYRTSGKMEWQ